MNLYQCYKVRFISKLISSVINLSYAIKLAISPRNSENGMPFDQRSRDLSRSREAREENYNHSKHFAYLLGFRIQNQNPVIRKAMHEIESPNGDNIYSIYNGEIKAPKWIFTNMAEALLIGPLANLGIYVATWAYKKYHQSNRNKEYDVESKRLVSAIDSLALFSQERSDMIRYLQSDMRVGSTTLGSDILF